MRPSELHYNRHGLRYVSEKEMKVRKEFVLSCLNEEKSIKPLESYQNEEKTLSLPELVSARHEDKMAQLKRRYQDFFEFPESREYCRYLQKKQEMEEDYEQQSYFVGLYRDADSARGNKHDALTLTLQTMTGTLFFGAGTLSATSKIPLAPVTASLFYIGSLLNFYAAYQNCKQLQKVPSDKDQIRMLLEDWYESDPRARYDRAILNHRLEQLNKAKPSQKRRTEKYELVRRYRAAHPKSREG